MFECYITANNSFRWLLVHLFALSLYIPISSAEPQDKIDQLFDMSFEQLMALEVTLASKSSASLNEVPSTVTLFTKEQIDRLSVENVYELLNYVPGFQVTRGDWVGAVMKEHARGVFLDNGYVLFMINGERINELSFGKASVYTPFIPLSVVERVEVIRGPGSALYGSNAFMGVVNVITADDANEVVVGIGQNNGRKISGSWSTKEDDLLLNILFDWRKSDGSNHNYNGEIVKDPTEHKYLGLFADYGMWQFSARLSQSDMDEYINLGGASADNIYESENSSLSAQYLWKGEDETSLTSKLLYSNHRLATSGKVVDAGVIPGLSNDFLTGPYYETRDIEFTSDYFRPLNVSWEFNGGISLKRSEQTQAGTYATHLADDGSAFILDDEHYLGRQTKFKNISAFSDLLSSQDSTSVYSQLKWLANNQLHLYFGARYDDVDGIGNNFSPRGALIYQVNQSNNFRIQYGEAFRVPVTNELYSQDSVTVGNPNLKPEEIETLELLWRYSDDLFQVEGVYFHNELKGFVNKIPSLNSSTQFTFANTVDKKIDGVELNARARFSDSTELFATYSRIFDTPINASYKSFATLGMSRVWQKSSFNINGIWRDTLSVDNLFHQSSYWLWNVKFTYKVNSRLEVALSVSNVLDKTYGVFEPRVSSSTMPGTNRQSWVTFNYAFQ